MFEAIHGSAPTIAGKDIANPSGLLRAAVMMLTHIGQPEVAERVKNAWLCTLEEGVHTVDIYKEGVSRKKVGTQEFAQAVIDNLDKKPNALGAVEYAKGIALDASPPLRAPGPGQEDAAGRRRVRGLEGPESRRAGHRAATPERRVAAGDDHQPGREGVARGLRRKPSAPTTGAAATRPTKGQTYRRR